FRLQLVQDASHLRNLGVVQPELEGEQTERTADAEGSAFRAGAVLVSAGSRARRRCIVGLGRRAMSAADPVAAVADKGVSLEAFDDGGVNGGIHRGLLSPGLSLLAGRM